MFQIPARGDGVVPPLSKGVGNFRAEQNAQVHTKSQTEQPRNPQGPLQMENAGQLCKNY